MSILMLYQILHKGFYMLNDDINATAADIGENLRTWRKLLGLTANQVAQRAQISLATYSKLENGHPGVAFGKVLAVFRALGLLDRVSLATDPYETDLGRARAEQILPQRVRK
jgi:transcriptional regulator with XRE-family HTH domain